MTRSTRPRVHGFARVLLAAVVALALAACTSDGAPAGTALPEASRATATAPATEGAGGTPGSAGTGSGSTLAPPDAEAALEHVRVLAGEIGSRFVGSEEEREAARYVADVLESAGYEVTIEEFPVELYSDESLVVAPGGDEIFALALVGAPPGEATGTLVFGGLGASEEISPDAADNVLLLDRGTLPFADKIANAERVGAAAVIIVNNEPGSFQGSLGTFTASIPVVSVAREARGALHAALNRQMTVRSVFETQQLTSQNVVGRSGDECRILLGAHYDSVTAGPGANDNASGTATMLELARAYRTEGLCAAAFGAEEVGLFGSLAYVEQHDLDSLVYMLNFDMTGKVTDPAVVGTSSLQKRVLGLLAGEGESSFRAASFNPRASSDHASFIEAGIPAITFYSGNDEFIHSAQDGLDNVDVASLETMLTAAGIALEHLLAEIGAPVS